MSVGVPKARRGEVWTLLAERGGLRDLETEWAERFPNLASEYDSLKSQLTSHQHAILIDLGNLGEILHFSTVSSQVEHFPVTVTSAAPWVRASAACSTF